METAHPLNHPVEIAVLELVGSVLVMGFLVAQTVKKKSACNAGDLGSTLDWEDPLEEGMVTHSSILAWRIPMDRRAWEATAHGVAESQAWLRD